MQRSTLTRVPVVSAVAVSLPPMYDWPVPVKRAILGMCVVLSIAAYVAMATGFIGLARLALELM